MARGWNPGGGDSLTPPGFVPKKRVVGSPVYVLNHPTRYRWAKHIVPCLKMIYREMGGPDVIHIDTYVWHPPYNPDQQILRDYQMYMADFWNPGGRGDPIDRWKGERIINLAWNDPGEPILWYYIWRGVIHNRFVDDFAPRFFASPNDPFNYHGDHPHIGWLYPGGVWR